MTTTTAALLLLLAGEVTAPLGPYARPGVAVPLLVRDETLLDLEGWKQAATSPVTFVHPPVVPCTVRDQEGKELLRLEAVPEKTLLVGVEGPVPPDYAGRIPHERGWQVLVVPEVDLRRLGGRSLGLAVFDRFVSRAAAATEFRDPQPLAPLPRLGNRAPEIYDAIPRGARPSPALRLLRRIGLAAVAVLALQLLLAWRRLTSRRLTLWGIGFVAVAGALAGAFATRSAYSPLETFRIDVEIQRSQGKKTSSYLCYLAQGPGGVAVPEPEWTPLFYRGPGDPWWSGPERKMEVEEGVMRLFSIGGKAPGPAASGAKGDREAAARLRDLAKRLQPPGEWQVTISGWVREAGRSRWTARISFRPRN